MHAPARNLLDKETSPYLLQHAANPVHWRPWGEAALAEARAEGKPILLSIGYAACHWCHVMAHESFENADTAARMNALYVCIKVDREERPDIDHLYMSALHALGEQGGWPLTMFLTPAGEPFWGGTYFPPEPRSGRPSFTQVLHGVADAYRTQPDSIRTNAYSLARALAAMSAAHPGGGLTPDLLDLAAAALLRGTDPEHGGLRGAPKFPNPPIFRFLWQDSYRTGTRPGRAALHLMLERMSQGGIYDHLGGGYARYSVDAVWLVPHFEKMLYDNAQLLELLALAHADDPSPLLAARAAETVRWLLRDMRVDPVEGHAAFAASEDADSEGEEGRFYVWTLAEIDDLLGAEAAGFRAAYDVTPDGNWEGKIILRRTAALGTPETEAALAECRDRLLAARAHRVRPGRDDKVLADWNGLAIAALCRAAAVFRQPSWREAAEDAFAFVLARMIDGRGRLQHAWRAGRGTAAGLLEDHAALARAALALYETNGDPKFLAHARRLVEQAEQWFGDAATSYFSTAADATDIPLGPAARPRSITDGATPSGNGLMAEVLARLHHLTGEPGFRDRADALLRAFSGLGERLAGAPSLLAAADLLEEGAVVVVTGPIGDQAADALHQAALAAPDPATGVLRITSTDTLPSFHPAFAKTLTGNQPAAWLCRAGICERPLVDPDMLVARLRCRNPSPTAAGASTG
jgi:uncharacterized protein YyaL (SSP411 family)